MVHDEVNSMTEFRVPTQRGNFLESRKGQTGARCAKTEVLVSVMVSGSGAVDGGGLVVMRPPA